MLLSRMLVAILLIAPLIPAAAQNCPEYTRRDGTVGEATDLPNGWFVYKKQERNGLFKSPLKNFSEETVAGTESHRPMGIDISDDGQWIVYVNEHDGGIYVVASDGSGTRARIDAELFNSASLAFTWTGFIRQSPKGTEIFYSDFNWQGSSYLCGTTVDLSGDQPVSGSSRIIAKTNPWLINVYSGSFAMWKDQAFGLFKAPGGETINAFLTVPNGGEGQASSEDIYQFATPPDKDYWGCGQTISHDGELCISNSAYVGNSCVPSKEATNQAGDKMDHKGFYITRFLRTDMPSIEIDEQIMDPTYGVSINWCPLQYQFGDYNEVDFNSYSFANNSDYVVGALKGSKAPVYGIWVINWKTNTWTLVSGDQKSTVLDDPAMFLPGASNVGERRDRRSLHNPVPVQRTRIVGAVSTITLEPGHRGVALLTLSGKLLWRYERSRTRGRRQVSIPGHIRLQSVAVAEYY